MTQDVTHRNDRSFHDVACRATLNGAALVRHTRYIRSVLFKKGVRHRDLADMTQEVFLTAWRAMLEGRFCPSPDRDPAGALRHWLFGIAWREASDYRERHFLKLEVVRRAPVEQVVDTISDEQLDARRVLEFFQDVPHSGREIMLRVALGEELREAAQQLGISKEAASGRLWRGREAFTQIIARRQNYPLRRALTTSGRTSNPSEDDLIG